MTPTAEEILTKHINEHNQAYTPNSIGDVMFTRFDKMVILKAMEEYAKTVASLSWEDGYLTAAHEMATANISGSVRNSNAQESFMKKLFEGEK